MLQILTPFLSADFIGKMVRTGVQSASASLVTSGVLSGDQQQQAAGAIALVASIIWTAFAHSKAAAKYGVAPNATTGGLQ